MEGSLASDPDGNGSLSYSLFDGNGTPDNAYFTMDINGTLCTVSALDYESASSHLIRLRAYDDQQAFVEGIFTVTVLDVNESVPNSPPSGLSPVGALSMWENEPIGSTVGVFSSVDPNGSGALHYYLLDGNGTSGNQYFALDLNGTLKTSVMLDYESNASHLIRVRVYDDGQAFAEGYFTVTVLDVNESISPSFDFNATTLEIAENQPVGSYGANSFPPAECLVSGLAFS